MPTKAARVSREGATASRQPAASTPPHIMLIVDENKDYQESNLPSGNNRYIIGNPEAPYLNQLADQYASATQEYSLFHPSFANYLALLSGATIGSGISVPHTDSTFVDQLSDAGVPWTAYMDGLNFPGAPSSCDPSATDQQVYDDVSPYYYEWDHNPFWYFTDVTSSGDCNNVVPYPGSTSLVSTLDGPGAPDFVWISPNGCNDGHDDICQYGETEVDRCVAAGCHESRGCDAGAHLSSLLPRPSVDSGVKLVSERRHHHHHVGRGAQHRYVGRRSSRH